jgi:hypothetical protein
MPLHGFPGGAQEGTDQRWGGALLFRGGFGQAT